MKTSSVRGVVFDGQPVNAVDDECGSGAGLAGMAFERHERTKSRCRSREPCKYEK